MIEQYQQAAAGRKDQGLPPLPLDRQQTEDLCRLLENPPAGSESLLLELIENRVPPGVDPAAEIKAGFLNRLARQDAHSPLIDVEKAVALLGTMLGGYNIQYLLAFLNHDRLAPLAAAQLEHTIFIAEAYRQVTDRT